jgi:3-hydroxyacyl-CoA dehydrogenase
VAIVGTGTIGASWATHYLARGFDVVATDPASGAETALRQYVHDGMEQPRSGWRTGPRHAAPQEVILSAKAHPAGGQTVDELASALDGLDQRLRQELPEIGEVFIDVTAHRGNAKPGA